MTLRDQILSYLPWNEQEERDKQVPEGAKVSVRGLGKIKLAKVGGTTKKDRISVVLHRYV